MRDMTDPWYEINIIVQADFETAEAIFEELSDSDLICGGSGDGMDHVCQRDMVMTMGPFDPDEEE